MTPRPPFDFRDPTDLSFTEIVGWEDYRLLEIRPVKVDSGNMVVEASNQREAEAWGVYGRFPDWYTMWVADFKTEAAAKKFVNAMWPLIQVAQRLKGKA